MRALATSLAGDQLERLRAAGHTARGEWRAGRGAKDVAMQVTTYYLVTTTRWGRGTAPGGCVLLTASNWWTCCSLPTTYYLL